MCSLGLSVTIPSPTIDEDDDMASKWKEVDSKFQCDVDRVSDYIYIGSLRGTSRPEALAHLGIGCAINASCKVVVIPGVDVFDVDLKDDDSGSPMYGNGTSLYDILERCHRYIEDAVTKKVGCLVFCHRGISRSATICSSYLMQRDHLTWQSALEHIQQHRQRIAPNFFFLKQLYVFQRSGYSWSNAARDYTNLSKDFEAAVKETTWGVLSAQQKSVSAASSSGSR